MEVENIKQHRVIVTAIYFFGFALLFTLFLASYIPSFTAKSSVSMTAATEDGYTHHPVESQLRRPLVSQPLGLTANDIETTIELPGGIDEGTVVYLPVINGQIRAFINGVPISHNEQSSRKFLGAQLISTIIPLPSSYAFPDANTVSFIAYDRSISGGLATPVIGDHSALERQQARQHDFMSLIARVVPYYSLILFSAALLSLSIGLRSIALGHGLVGAGLVAGYLTSYAGGNAPLQSGADILVPLVLAAGVYSLSSRKPTKWRLPLLFFTVGFTAAVVVLFFSQFDFTGRTISASSAILICGFGLIQTSNDHSNEIFLKLCGYGSVLLLAFFHLPAAVELRANHLVPFIIVLGLGLYSSVLLIRYLRQWIAYRGAEQTALRDTISKQQEALDEEMRRSAVLEERQRLVRDMHDGVGGQLQTLLMQLRRRSISRSDMKEAVQNGLTDLRLIVDSLDNVGEDFGAAIATFRVRARHQADAVGVSLKWDIDREAETISIASEQILQIYRFLQECVSNALRHSGGSEILIAIKSVDSALHLSVRDNGDGLPDTPKEGRGLVNLRDRAKRLNADLVMTRKSTYGGLCIELKMPRAMKLNANLA